jgi:hypothetical protein
VSLENVIAVLKLVQSEKTGVVSALVKEFSMMFVLRHYQDVIVQQVSSLPCSHTPDCT